jgi:hypothetical protein
MTMTTSIIAERTHWAARISAAWQHSVDSIIETGRLLLAAKADPAMQHGEWGTMVESDLPFNRHTAHKLMQIARDKRLTNVSHGKHLPPSWTTLYELTKLDDETFDQKLRDGTIHPDMQRKEASKNRIFSRDGVVDVSNSGTSKTSSVESSRIPTYPSANVSPPCTPRASPGGKKARRPRCSWQRWGKKRCIDLCAFSAIASRSSSRRQPR